MKDEEEGAENLLRLMSRQDFLGQPKKKKIEGGEKAFFLIDLKIYILTNISQFNSLIVELTNIADPISKPAHINEFSVTKQSLLRAKSLGRQREDVLLFLEEHMRNKEMPGILRAQIQEHMSDSKCCRLYLSEEEDRNIYMFQMDRLDFQVNISSDSRAQIQRRLVMKELSDDEEIVKYKVQDYRHNDLSEMLFKLSIPILSKKNIVKTQFDQKMERYAELYKNKGSLHCKNLKIELKAFTKLRDYQQEALKTVVFTHERQLIAKSGYVVLPCGAGKTLLGIAICAKIKKETLIVCSSDAGADQWKRQIEKWSQGIPKDQIIILTAKSTEDYKFHVNEKKPYIYISTYSNLKSKLEGKEVKNEHEWMKLMPWGLIIFDEAQWLPAPGNSLIANSLMAHVKIGLTATPLREDNNIKALVYMIGPQLYVGSWKNFVEMGYLANPKCLQIRTKMTKNFSEMYLNCQKNQKEQKQKQALYQSNPNKVKALIYLLEYHESLNDNIIVFCDKISLIYFLAENLQIPLLSGKTLTQDRNFVFDMFREGVYKTILLSRIGDEAIDLPNANVAIEINMHKGSRRQMLQRLGRIMRPKEASSSESYNAIFYTIVSDETLEMDYFRKRRNCLVDLGFQYDIRFFGSGFGEKITDIYQDDKTEMKEAAEARYKRVIENDMDYWRTIKTREGERDF